MGDFRCFTLFMMIALAICTHSLSGLGFVITNGPQDTTVCMNDMAKCRCGFDGVNPAVTTPDWIIVTRSSDGSITDSVTIDGEDIVDNKHDGLMWQIGQSNITSSPNSKLVIGPLDETLNQSSYQCVFRLNQVINGSVQSQIVKSSVGTLTVVGPPSIGNIVVDETCTTSLSISWDTHIHPVCGGVSQLVTISSPTSGATTFNTNDSNFTFTNLNSNTSYDVTVTVRYKRDQITSSNTTIKTSSSHPTNNQPLFHI
ncbi:receptor-type tyrosine-protein phosphatase H-like [Dysidea avara]|uniref:receptor-type tyrosine-protein phosphatase H-like n=1 Tax=Dysidea avara TaxID=196820 RepID=UPI003319109F